MPSGWSLDPDGNIGARWMVTTLKPNTEISGFGGIPENSGYRTRLTDLLAHSKSVLQREDRIFCQTLFLPKDMDEIEALTKGLFKAKTREKIMP
jgi:hypothetical protein